MAIIVIQQFGYSIWLSRIFYKFVSIVFVTLLTVMKRGKCITMYSIGHLYNIQYCDSNINELQT